MIKKVRFTELSMSAGFDYLGNKFKKTGTLSAQNTSDRNEWLFSGSELVTFEMIDEDEDEYDYAMWPGYYMFP
jgi:hypothetical protein